MKTPKDLLNLLANIAIIAAAACLIYFVVHGRHPGSASDLKTGQKINWLVNQGADHNPTLIVALQTGCPFCESEMPFYRELAGLSAAESVDLVFVLPQPINIAKKYLAENGVAARYVEQRNLAEIGVRATPTLIFVSRAGVLENYWVGALDSSKQAEVRKAIAHL
jgi:thiol-disulfide isomerase/thioredoxin